MTTSTRPPSPLGVGPGDVVVDEKGTQYRLGHLVGRGGQGAVHAVQGGRYAVKTVTNASRRERDALRLRLEYVRRLDLGGLPISRPRTMLRDPTGYVMDLLDGVSPLSTLSRLPRDVAPDDLVAWHVRTGGLRKRLRVLASLADTLAQLGGRALVYGDLSPANVLVSSDADHAEVWLIDPDNLHHTGVLGAPCVFTPRYGAPELVRQQAPPTPATDAHAFAVLAFETLTLSHPLIGDDVADAEPDVEAAALRGEWPYVHHPTDGRNRRSTGLPLDGVASKALRALFECAFVEGLEDPARRPSLDRWRDTLYAAVDLTVREPESSATSIPNSERRCFWTDRPLGPLAFGTFLRWVPRSLQGLEDASNTAAPAGELAFSRPAVLGDVRGKGWGQFLLAGSEPFVLTRRHVHCSTGAEAAEPCLRLSYDPAKERVLLEPLDDGAYAIYSPTGSTLVPPKGLRAHAPQGKPFGVHLGPLDAPHRVASVTPIA